MEEVKDTTGATTSDTTGKNAEPLELPAGHTAVELPAPVPVAKPVQEIPSVKAEPIPVKPVSPASPPELPKDAAQKAGGSALFGGNAVEVALQNQKERATEDARTAREIGIAPRPQTVEKKPIPIQTQEAVPRLRTYASDMSEEIRKRGETLSSIVSAERTKRAQSEPSPEEAAAEKKRNAALITGGIALLGFGVLVLIGIALFSFFSHQSSHTPTYTSIITPNKTVAVPFSSQQPLIDRLAAERASASLNLGDVENVVIEDGGVLATPAAVLQSLGAPDVLSRNTTAVMVGVHSFNHNQPFIVLEVSAYDLAFQGMLAWEPTMAASLGSFFAPSAGGNPPITLPFSDVVFQNQDVRESPPSWPIVYSFPQKNILVITTNESTLKEILSRLTIQ